MNSPLSNTQSSFPISQKSILKNISGNAILFVIFLIFGIGVHVLVSVVTTNAFGYQAFDESMLGILLLFANILIGIGIIGFLLDAIYQYLYYKTYRYDLNADVLTIKKGVILPKEIVIPIQRIQNVNVNQDIFDRMFGIYEIIIESATDQSAIQASINGLEKANAEGLQVKLSTSIGIQSTMVIAGMKDFPVETREVIASCFVIALFSPLIYLYIFGKSGSNVFGILFTIGLSALSMIGVILSKQAFSFELREKAIAVKQGILTKKESLLPYESIQNVFLRQGLVDRLFNLKDIRVELITQQNEQVRNKRQAKALSALVPSLWGFGGKVLVIQGLSPANADKLRDLILERIKLTT
jgi:membrane protein YdbS with pleckstrin-like domain